MSLAAGCWILRDRHEGQLNVRSTPFDAIELDLGALWI
jgi:hypothetical protein